MLSYGVKERSDQLLCHRARVIARRCAPLAALGALLGCTELDSPADDCEVLGDGLVQCRRAISEPDPESNDLFDCLPEGEPPFAGISPPPPLVSYVTAIVDFTNPNPDVAPPNLTILVCQSTDVDCEEPVPSIATPIPGAVGAARSILMPYGLDGYLRLQAEGYVRQEYYFGGPMIGAPSPEYPTGEVTEIEVPAQAAPLLQVPAGTRLPAAVVRGEPIVMLRESQANAFFTDLAGPDAVRDPQAGLLAVRTIDCDGARAGGISLDLNADPGAGFGFVVTQNNIPRASNPTNPAGTTESRQGGAGFANIPPSVYSPFAILGDGRTYGGQVGFRVRANQFTNGEIRTSYPYGR